MNQNQRWALVAVAVAIGLMLIHPPYKVHGFGASSSSVVVSGYAFIFDLPQRATVDAVTLIAQWIGVAVIGAIAYKILEASRQN